MTTEKDEQEAIVAMMTLFTDIMVRHGSAKGQRIVAAVGQVTTGMGNWPNDIRKECVVEFLRLHGAALKVAGVDCTEEFDQVIHKIQEKSNDA
jgi:hypothetical protein